MNTITCNNNVCPVKVAAPGFALVFPSQSSLGSSEQSTTTFSTTAGERGYNTATVNPAAPDSTTHVSYSSAESKYLHRPAHQWHRPLTQQSELSGALGLDATGAGVDVDMVVGQEPNSNANININMNPSYRGANGDGGAPSPGLFTFGMMHYLGPYHPDYLLQQQHHAMHSPHHHSNNPPDSLPFATLDGSDMESAVSAAASGMTLPSSS
jgi:hypothetical protein